MAEGKHLECLVLLKISHLLLSNFKNLKMCGFVTQIHYLVGSLIFKLNMLTTVSKMLNNILDSRGCHSN